MNKKELLQEIRKRFNAKLQAKTGWGKNDVIEAYDSIVLGVLLDSIDEKNCYD